MAFIKSWKFMAIIFAVLTVVVVVLLAVGISTHTEAGFDPDFNLLPDAAARHELTFPIRVCAASYDPTVDADGIPYRNGHGPATAEDARAVSDAIGVINGRLGGFLVMGDQREGCAIEVTIGVPIDDTWHDLPGGRAWICQDACCIETANTGTSEMLSLALQHELGHCLGLAHDDFTSSIMSPNLGPTPDGSFPPRITDSDRDLLRQAYRPISR